MRTFTRLLSIAIVFLLLVTPKDCWSQTMWPGDVNNNGIVNGVDALYWNHAFGETGTLRPNATTDWQEQDLPNPLWGGTLPNGLDFSYADCDGNGVVDELDFMDGIIDNCGQTHGIITPDEYFNGVVGVDPGLCLDPESIEVYSGEMLNIDLKLGDENINVEDFQGITFTLSYNGEFVEDNSNFMLDLSDSWVDPSGTGEGTESYVKNFSDTETGEVTILRTASSIQNGSGKIGRVSIVIEDDIVGLITNDTMTVKVQNIKMVNQAGIAKRVAPDCEAVIKILEPRSSTNCPQIVNPVCGDNGVTYINCCYAAAAGVTNFTTGVCYSGCIDETEMNPNANCSYTYNPVCGCNDVTYLNSCVAQANGVVVYTQGACTDNCYDPTYVEICGQTSTDPVSGVVNLLCPQASAPVCGCDGITYTNSCYAQASGMSFYTPGPCANNCVDPNSMDQNLICPSAYDPVCGCNGVNYSNSCYADAAGVLNYTPGTCGSSSWCSQATPISCGDFMPNETTIGAGNNITSYPGCTSQTFAGPDKVYVINKNTSGDLQIGIEIMTPGMDLDMFLLSDNCNQVTCVKSSTTSNNTSNNEGIIYEDAPIGTYYLVIDGQYGASEGNFRLEVNCGYLNCDNAVHLTCGVPVSLNNSAGTDEVSLYGCDGNVLNVENNGPEMIHTFTTTTAGPVNVSLYGLTANLELFMLRSCDRGDCIDYSQNPGTNNEEIEAYLQPGTYYVVVDGYNGGVCDYNLLVNCASNCTYDINATAADANCGQNNGSINITSTGGIPGFIIQWTGPVSGSFSTYGTNCTVSGLPGGTYTVTATDANGCEDTSVVVIGNSETNLNVTATPHDAECMDQGSISVSIVNGSPYYQIFISGPTSGSTTTSLSNFNIVNLDPGTYTLQIVDANGCSNTQEVVIGQSASDFVWTYTVTDAACGGTGSIHVVTQNGIPSYNIIVSGPTSGSATTNYSTFNLNNLPGGTYDITVEDGNWCQVTQTITIEDSNLTIGLDDISGYCGSNGSIVVNMSNGNPGYHISWDGPSAGSANVGTSTYTIPNLEGGAYSVTVTDNAGCTDYQVITLFNSLGSIDFDLTAANGSCGQPGSIWLGVTSGTSPYTITWSGNASGTITTPYTNYDIPWLPDGTYSVQVTDADGCSSTDEVTINNSMNNLEINTTPSNGICGQPGSIWVSISNGTPGYSLSWSGESSGSTTINDASYDIQNLAIGDYTIVVTDGSGCQTTTTATIGDTPSNIAVTATPFDGICGQPGSIDLAIANGAGGYYSITWSGASSGSANSSLSTYTIPDAVAGNYTIVITDDNNCSATTTTTVGNTANNLAVTGSADNGVCGNNGTVNLAITGGAGNYGIAWSGAGTGSANTNSYTYTITDATSGTYNVTITDGAGCTATTSVVVANGTNNVTVVGTANNGICGNNGSVDLTLSGGTGGYIIDWSGTATGSANSNGNSFTITDASSGNYNITVTDGQGCQSTTTTVVDNSTNGFSVTGTSADGTCNNPGSLWIYMDGGTANYTVEWDGPVSGSAPTTADSYDVQGTPAGTYLVTVTDANGCVATTTIVVNNTSSGFSVTGTSADGTCNNPGSLWIYMDGGTANYTVEWDGPVSGSAPTTADSYDVQGTPAGTYLVTVTDANGCVATTTIVVNTQGSDVTVTGTANNGSCGAYGSILLSIGGGNAPYTINYTGTASGTATANGSSYNLTGLAAGTYNFTITDANGCTATETTSVSTSGNITATSTSNAADCASGVGSIHVSVTAGTPSYSVEVVGPTSSTTSQFGNIFTIADVVAGNYSITITDANNCSTTITQVVGGSGCCMTASMTGVDAECGTNGSIWIDVYNGATDYTVTWTGTSSGTNTIGIDNFEIPNLPGGAYEVTVEGADGCTVTQNVSVNSTGSIVVTGTASDGVCGQNGSATIAVTGGVASYDVNWTGTTTGSNTYGAGTFTVPNLPVGTYTFTVSDGNGCTASTGITINEGANNLTAVGTTTNASCESPTGAIHLTMTGGSPNYTVVTTGPTSSTTTQTGNTFSLENLIPGGYLILITDANGCSTNFDTNVDGPVCCMTATMTGVDAECGQNGSIWIDVYNGVTDYTVTWTGPSNGTNTIDIDNFEIPNLLGGTYTVTVEDALGCTVTQIVTVNSTGGITVTASGNTGVCGGNGSANITVAGGAPTYNVSWTGTANGNNHYTTGSFTVPNLPAGSYTFSVTDGNGCTGSQTVVINSGANTLTATSTTAAADCTSEVGSVTIAVAGGTPNYTVTTAGPTPSTTTHTTGAFTLGALTPGNYDISITDANGCSTSLTALVGGPGCCMTATMTGVDATCGANGSIWIDVFNGAPDYTVTWTGNSSGSSTIGINNFEIPNLPGGSYTVTVEGTDGCSVTQTVTVNATGGVDVTLTPVDGDCGQNGSIWVDVNAGTPDFTVTWTGITSGSSTTGLTNFEIPNLLSGTYTVTIEDANGCSSTSTVNVTTGAGTISATTSSTAADCASGLGSIAVAVSGGSPNYTVTTAGPTPSTTTQAGSNFTLSGLAPGNYTISIADANGCSTVATTVVGGAGCCMTATMTGVDAGCGTNGSIWIDVFNGDPNYTVVWEGPSSGSNSTNLNNFEIPNLLGGNYNITITDSNNCSVTQNVTINVVGSIDITTNAIAGTCGGNGAIDVNILSGTPSFTVSWTGAAASGSNTTNSNAYNIANLPAGNYTISVEDADGCTANATVTVTTSANDLSVTATGGNADCTSGLGQIAVAVANGAPGYTVTLVGPTPGTTTQTTNGFNLTGLLPGNYTVTVLDANGCSTTVGTTVTNTACCMTTNLTGINGACGNDGSIIVSIDNGNPNYTITLTGSGTTISTNTTANTPYTITNVGAGTYTVTVADANGCTNTGSVSIATTPAVTFAATGNEGACGAAGSATISILTGTAPYTIGWLGNNVTSNGGTTNIPNLLAGTYTFSVIDANGCTANQTVTIDSGTNDLTAAAVGGNADCVSGLGQIAVTVANGTANYTVTLEGPTPGTTTQTANGFNLTGLAPGNYTVTIVDANGCSTTVGATVTDTACCMTTTLSGIEGVCGSDGSIVVAIANGTPNYTISWSGGGSATATTSLYTIPNVPAGTFTVTVVDANGCTTTGNVTIATSPDVTFTTASNPGACGGPGSADLTILTGTAPYTISWAGNSVASAGGTTNIPNLTPGNYTFTISDANNCSATQVVQVITGANDLTATAIGSNADCATGLGHISIAISNGVPTYTITIAGPSGSTITSAVSAFNIDDLLPGDYTITVQDATGCTTTVTTTVTDGFCCFGATAVATNATCGPDGSIAITTTEGTAPYTITYSGTGMGVVTTPGPNYTLTGLVAGSYTIVVEDAAGCDVTTTVTIGGSSIIASATGSTAACLTGLGTITGTATGVGPYNVVISGPSGGSTTIPASPFTLTDLLPGTYSLTLTDANGCVTSVSNIIILPTDECCMTANLTATAATCDDPGKVTIDVFNGLADYTAAYNATGSGSVISSNTNFCIPDLASGSYAITITDAAGCEVIQTVVVEDDCCIADACFAWSENSTDINFTSNHVSATATYVWTFGDGSTGTGANPVHAYPGSGNYDVCVTVTEGCGSETCCETIQVANGLGTVIIRAGIASGGTGNTVSVPVTSENCDMLTSFSASLTTCDESIAQIVGITPAAINPTFNATNNTFTYFDFNGQGVPCDDVVLFYIDVELVGTGGQSCDIMITCEPLPCEVGGLENGTGVVVEHVVIDGTITIYTMYQMNGMVRTFWMDGIMAAEVQANGDVMNEMDMTDENGAYIFPELIGEEEYIVAPEKDTLPANGLSTFALYIGQQFILGMDPVEIHSPYQIIAGDANCNNSFSALDLFLIQQIIIGTATEFPSCPSWVFVCEDHPLPEDFNTYNVFPYANSDTLQLNQDSYANFVGVKVGDILGNANPHNRPTTATDTRDRSEITFNVQNGAVRAGEEFTLDFTSTEFENFVSFQMALDYADDKMKFIEVIENENSEMSSLISGISPRNENQVRFSWFNLQGKATSLTNTEVAFSVKFEATADIANLSELFEINKFDTFNAEAHDQYSEPFNIVLEFVDPAITTTEANGAYQLLQNTPNPFTNTTIIRFELPEAMHAKLVVTNTLGQVVAEFANDYPKGMSQVEWNRNDLPSGLYNYTLSTDSYNESRSMIIID